MKALYIKETDDSPNVVLDKEKRQFEISGKSLPEDVSAFYDPLIKWFESYIKNPLPSTPVTVKMTYFNTASSKLLLDVFMVLEKLEGKDHEVIINWHYPAYDEEMKDAGVEYSEMLDLRFNFIPEENEITI